MPRNSRRKQVLGVHRHVGLELALPPAVGVLDGEQRVDGPVEGLLGGGEADGVEERSLTSELPVDDEAGQRCRGRRRRRPATATGRSSASSGGGEVGAGPGDRPLADPGVGQAPGQRGDHVAGHRSPLNAGAQLVGQRAAGVEGEQTGSDFLRSRRSLPTGLPVTSGSPQMPSTSSTAWNDRPSSSP